jgi:Fic family protein
LILSRWKPLFALVPVESLIRDQQQGYYAALNDANQAGASTPFVFFMLRLIRDALAELIDLSARDQVSDQVSDQVAALLTTLGAETLSAGELMSRLGLRHRAGFRQRYLQPALATGLIVMTRPDTPRSSVQRYRRA